MVRLAINVILLVGAAAGLAAAAECTGPETYCGSRLVETYPSYRQKIKDVLEKAGQPTDDAHISESLFFFFCLPEVPKDPEIYFLTYCDNGCVVKGGLQGEDACPIRSTDVSG